MAVIWPPTFAEKRCSIFGLRLFFGETFGTVAEWLGFFPYKPAILGDPQLWKPPNSCFFEHCPGIGDVYLWLADESIHQSSCPPPARGAGATTTVSWIWGILCVGYYETIPQFFFVTFWR